LSLYFKILDKTEEWALWWWCRGCSWWWSCSRSSCPARACLACSHAGFAACHSLLDQVVLVLTEEYGMSLDSRFSGPH